MAEHAVESDIGTYVVSYGGQGSKLVTRLLHPNRDPEFLERAHVHWRYPPVGSPAQTRFVYLFGDPRNTVISFFQRRERRHANHGFFPPVNADIPMPRFVQWALRNLECSRSDIPEDLDLASYLARFQSDIFEIEDHLCRWLRRDDLDLVFVRYDVLWEQPEAVAEFLGILPSDVPARSPRRADWRQLPEEQQQQITALYAGAIKLVESLPNLARVQDISRHPRCLAKESVIFHRSDENGMDGKNNER